MTPGPDRNAARLKLPSKFTDMTPYDMEYGGGNTKEILGWILIGVGIAVVVAGVVVEIYGIVRCCECRSVVKTKKEILERRNFQDEFGEEIFKCKCCMAGGYLGMLLGAGGIVGGCFLKDSSD